MAINVELLKTKYFCFDKPVEYKLDMDMFVSIKPIALEDSEEFLSAVDIINIDKNSLPYPEIISMSYLQFLCSILIAKNGKKENIEKFMTIMRLCLGWNDAGITIDKNGKFNIFSSEQKAYINPKQFEDIRKIILFQNIVDYDDEYIAPDVKKVMDDYNRAKNAGLDLPDLERRMAIVTAHCGISRQEQAKMSFRAHTLLFKEVCDEVEFYTTRPMAILGNAFSKKKSEIEHWIFKKKKNKYDKYFVSEDKFNRAMGGDGSIKRVQGNMGEKLSNQYDMIKDMMNN